MAGSANILFSENLLNRKVLFNAIKKKGDSKTTFSVCGTEARTDLKCLFKTVIFQGAHLRKCIRSSSHVNGEDLQLLSLFPNQD